MTYLLDRITANKSTKKKPTHTESKIQQAYIRWVRASNDPRLSWVHSSQSAGFRSIPARQRAKAEGLTSGVADVCVPYPCGKYHGLYLEFKSAKRKQTPDQARFQKWCERHDYQYHVVRSTDQAIEVTRHYLSADSLGKV